MINLVLSYIFSAVNFSALIVLTLCLFRFRLKRNIGKIIITSLLMSIVSKIFMLTNLSDIAPVLQLLILILIFKFVFKESLLYSFLSNILGFIIFIVIDFVFAQILIYYNLIDASNLGGAANTTTYICQIAESIIIYIVAFGMKYLNQGFGFDDNIINKKIKTKNIYFVAISSLSASILFVIFYLLLANRDILYLTISIAILIILASILMILYIKRDKEHYQ